MPGNWPAKYLGNAGQRTRSPGVHSVPCPVLSLLLVQLIQVLQVFGAVYGMFCHREVSAHPKLNFVSQFYMSRLPPSCHREVSAHPKLNCVSQFYMSRLPPSCHREVSAHPKLNCVSQFYMSCLPPSWSSCFEYSRQNATRMLYRERNTPNDLGSMPQERCCR